MATQGLRKLISRAAIVVAAIVGSVSVSSALAAIDLRVESRPSDNPIEAYVSVTDAAGISVGGLTAGSFTLTLDGNPLTIQLGDFSRPPSANPNKNVSVVFAMEYSSSIEGDARAAMEGAVVDFINSMNFGDYAAIVKFNSAVGESIVQPLTRIDGATGTDALVNAAMLSYFSLYGSTFYDGVIVALDHFLSPPAGVTLPSGPMAVVVMSDGDDRRSINTQDFIINKASSVGIPLFTIGVGPAGSTGSNVMNALAARTGGNYISAPTQAEITSAYATIASRLDNGYLLSFASSITDCNPHTLAVTVAGQGTTETGFTRCDATTGPVTVPNVVNLTQAAAATAVSGAGLAVGLVTQQSNATVPAGRVSSQYPASGVGVTAGSAVYLVVSTGPVPAPGPVAVPYVVNLTQAAATTAITGAGLAVGTITRQSSATVPSGSVTSQNPNAGTSVAAGSVIALVVSTGLVDVPWVTRLTEPEATTAITGAGLAVGTVRHEPSAAVLSGTVITQNPLAGQSVAAGSAVLLLVSTGPGMVTVPNVLNQTLEAAHMALADADLMSGKTALVYSATVPYGIVINQNPPAGTIVSVGSYVTLVVSLGPDPNLPTVSLSASPASIAAGATSSLTWSSTNATACTASGGWSGTRATSGSGTTGELFATTSFTLTCTGPGGTGSQTVTVSVTSPPKKSEGGGAIDFVLLALLLGAGLRFGRT